MTVERILPAVIFTVLIGAAVLYFYAGDWRRAGYWLSAAAITFFVTV
jgi:hypothetical protein